MKQLFSFFIIFCIVIPLLSAQEESIDWTNPETFSENNFQVNFEKDPFGAFETNSERAWEFITKNPSLFTTNVQLLDAAFINDPLKAADLINKNVYLLHTKIVWERFDEAIVTNLALLNEFKEAKRSWLKDGFDIELDHLDTEILSYDGTTIATSGEKGTTFRAKDFPLAKILADGSLQWKGHTFENTKKLEVQSQDGNSFLEMSGGLANLKGQDDILTIKVKPGEQPGNVVVKSSRGEVGYAGQDFTYSSDGKTVSVESKEQSFQRVQAYESGIVLVSSSNIFIKGKIEEKVNGNPEEFIIKADSPATLYFPNEKSVLNVEGEVFFTQYPSTQIRQAEAGCPKDLSCVIKLPETWTTIDGESKPAPNYQGKLIFQNVQNGDKFNYKTIAYHNAVDVRDLQRGSVTFTSVTEEGDVKSSVSVNRGQFADLATRTVSPEVEKLLNNVQVQVKGKLSDTNAGRFDISYKEGDEEFVQHWSSNKYQKEDAAQYFERARESFVTCPINSCEETFARAFGKLLGPSTKEPLTTIIVAGDNAQTAQSLEPWCKQVGCYILNSRDSPPKTASQHLVVTGHHYYNADNIWRDPVEEIPGADHVPIDTYSFRDFPQGDIRSVTFSACNTVTKPEAKTEPYSGFSILDGKYKNLVQIQGYNGIAPLIEPLPRVIGQEEISQNQYSWKRRNELNPYTGTRSWYVRRDDGQWVWTSNNKECYSVTTSFPTSCTTTQIASK